jgi:DNA gyrase subunit A
MALNQRIIPVNIEDQMKSAYIDYSMSVIVSRALPDVRDGMKPVHRRVLYGMSDLGLTYNKAYKKSARIVGEVLGKYHPHGDSSVYDTMVRMAQHWSLRYPLVDGQGNFGSMDGDSPAAMRYTEARLERISDEMLADINKDTVDFALNFDDTLEEPTVLPTRIPNLLINGASGIAVGMATNMLPHNLSEVIDGIIAQLHNPDIAAEKLTEYIKGPDFPTGGIIYGTEGVKEAFATGRGRVVVRGRAEIQTAPNGRETIVVTEIPYQVNKANLVAKIAELVNDQKIGGVSDIRDESDRDGLRIVVDVRKDAMANVVLSQLYKYSALQTSYGVNNVALVNGRPQLLSLQDIIREFIKFRIEVILRRTRYDLRKAIARAHILVGLLIALDYIDKVIDLIRGSSTPEEARNGLMEGKFIDDRDAFWKKFGPLIEEADTEEYPREEDQALSEAQARAILDMRLQKLTGLERDKVKQEYDEIQKQIAHLKSILESEDLQREIVQEELEEVKEKYGDERRTDISFADGEISIEDMIPNEEVVVTISHLGYIKRTLVSEYRKQSRGGRGSRGSKTRDADFIEHLFIASTHNYLLLFTEQGRCHWLRVYEIPEATKASSGRVIQNILAIPKDDRVKAYINIEDLTDEEYINNHFIVFCTRNGLVKKTSVEAYSRPRSSGINAITINDGDQLIDAKLTDGKYEVFLASRSGRAIRFSEEKVRSMGRTAAGVRGISLNDDGKDIAVGMVCIDPKQVETGIMVLSERGMGKRTIYSDYRLTNRGGKGVINMKITDKTGGVLAIKAVTEEDDMMITTRLGIVIRMAVSDIRVMGRATQGVRLIRMDKKDEIADIAIVRDSEDESDIPLDKPLEGAPTDEEE